MGVRAGPPATITQSMQFDAPVVRRRGPHTVSQEEGGRCHGKHEISPECPCGQCRIGTLIRHSCLAAFDPSHGTSERRRSNQNSLAAGIRERPAKQLRFSHRSGFWTVRPAPRSVPRSVRRSFDAHRRNQIGNRTGDRRFRTTAASALPRHRDIGCPRPHDRERLGAGAF
jgi:hypothetical protein